MRRVNSIIALTLIELIVSMVLVCIVMLGIFSINNVLSSNNQDYGQRYFVRSSTQNSLTHITNNASLAIGSASFTPADPAIVFTGQGMAAANSLCIHQNISPGPYVAPTTIDNSPSLNTPGNTTNDRSLCYTWIAPVGGATDYQIVYCSFPFLATGYQCNAANVAANNGTGPVYLGTSFVNPTYTFTYPTTGSPTTPLQFTVTIQNCLNNAATGAAACSATGTSGDMVNNPEIQLSGNAFPQQVGP